MGRLATPIIFYNDSAGRTLPYSKLYFYESGTTTPKNTYSDVGLTQINPNPLTSDAAGRFSDIFLTTGLYRMQLRDRNGNIIFTQDNLARTIDGNDATNIDNRLTIVEADIVALEAEDVALDGRLTTAESDINTLQTDLATETTRVNNILNGTYFPTTPVTGGAFSPDFGSTKTGCTISNATPPVVTTGTAHGLSTGDIVYIENSTVSAFNDRYYVITSTGANTYSLDGEAARGAATGADASPVDQTLLTISPCYSTSIPPAYYMAQSSTYTKIYGNPWAAGTGNGGYAGSVAAGAGWIAVFQITDGTNVDYAFNITNDLADTLANTSYSGGRRIGWVEAKSNTELYFSNNDQSDPSTSWFVENSINYTQANPGTNPVKVATGVPPNTIAILSVNLIDTGAGANTKYLWLGNMDQIPPTTVSVANATIASTYGGAANDDHNMNQIVRIRANSAGEILYKLSASDAGCTVNINTLGWVDERGVL